MVKLRKLFRRERLVKALKSLGALRLRVSHSSLVLASLLFLILLLAFMVRLLPMRWGFYLSEFDPYYQYRLAKHMVENGFFGPNSWIYWHDTMSWYPRGRPIASTSFPGLALTAASFYLILNALGLPITLLELSIVFPVIMAILTCLAMYFLGKDIGGKIVGLFSAFFLALNASYIGRTSWGFFDDETVGIFAILLFMFFFLRSIETKRSLKSNLVYAIAAGLSLGYLFASWGAARYPMGMTIVFVFVLLLLRRYSSRLLFSYSTTFGIALFIAVNVPFLGFKFLTENFVLTVLGAFLLLCAYEGVGHIKTTKMKTVFMLVFFAFCAFSLLMLSWFGYVRPLEVKYLTILNPSVTRQELIASIQEHRPAAWGSFYYNIGIGAFFLPIGLFFAVRNPTNRNIFLTIFGLTSIYFASSMIRLTLLLAPAISLLWALALVQLLRPFITIMKEIPAIPRRKTRFATHVGKEFSGALLIGMFLLLTFTFVLPNPRIFSQADTPTTIASASIPLKPDNTVRDWIDTLAWMRENLPPDAVVASWWDYGYWITVWGNKTSLADNGTWNRTQIQNIGYMFMSNETEAIEMLKNYDATHVLVFTTFDTNGNDVMFGDEGKWRWMARIASQQYPSLNESDFGAFDNQTGRWEWNDLGQSTVIYKLMTYGKETKLGRPPSVTLTHFDLTYFSKGEGIPVSNTRIFPLVVLYEVKYG